MKWDYENNGGTMHAHRYWTCEFTDVEWGVGKFYNQLLRECTSLARQIWVHSNDSCTTCSHFWRSSFYCSTSVTTFQSNLLPALLTLMVVAATPTKIQRNSATLHDATFLTNISIISYTAFYFIGLPEIRLKEQNNTVNLPYKNRRMVFSFQSR